MWISSSAQLWELALPAARIRNSGVLSASWGQWQSGLPQRQLGATAMSALHLAITVITAIVFIMPSEFSVITRAGTFQDLTPFSWFPDHTSLGQAQLRSCHLWKFASLINRVQNSWLVFWCFKEVRTGKKRMLFATGEICYTPRFLLVLLKGIIQRTSRNRLFELLLYDTNITFYEDVQKYRYTLCRSRAGCKEFFQNRWKI